MSTRMQSAVFGIALSLLVSACGGGGGGSAPGGALPSSGGNSGTGTLPQGSASSTFALTLQQYTPVNTAATRRRAAFISPATAQISLTIVSVNGIATSGAPMTFAVSPSSPNCAGTNGVVTCNLAATIPIGNDVLTATTLNANSQTLGSSTITATVAQNATNRIALSVGGQIANLQIYLSQNHFTPGTAANADVIVVPLDQSGAEIVNPGDYNPAIAVTSSSSAGGHLSLVTDGTNTGQSGTLNSPNDQVVVAYDGGGTSGSSTIKADAGNNITASKSVSISAAALGASSTGSQFVTSSSYIFTAPGQTGTITVSGGTGPYTVVSSDPTLATITGAGPYTITSVGYGVSGSATITVTDSLSAQHTIPVTFIAPAIVLTPGTCGGTSCTAAGIAYTVPLGGPTGALSPSTLTATGGTGSYTYFFISSGLTTSTYATVGQAGGSFTITPSGFGNDALIISSGNQTAYYGITASADQFGASLPRAIGMVVESVGKFYSATLPATVTNASASPALAGFNFIAGNPPSIDATPTLTGGGNFTFTSSFGQTTVPYVVFAFTFGSYPGSGELLSTETAIPADEQFTGTGQTDSVNVGGAVTVTAQSSNPGVATVSVAGHTLTVGSVGSGTATITVTDTATGASASYTVSVTTTTIPIAGHSRRQ
jgi:hypothetical protein